MENLGIQKSNRSIKEQNTLIWSINWVDLEQAKNNLWGEIGFNEYNRQQIKNYKGVHLATVAGRVHN